MKALALLCLLIALPAYAGKPKSCGDDKPQTPPPNPTTPTAVKKHKSDDGLSFAEGAAIVIGVGLTYNFTEGWKAKVGQ